MSGDTHTYHSSDRAVMVENADGEFQCPTSVKNLNSNNDSELHISHLRLEVGAPLMILSEWNPHLQKLDFWLAPSSKSTLSKFGQTAGDAFIAGKHY